MPATFPTLLPFLLFAFVASITPGPTNILVLSHSARYGWTAAMPIILGACAGAALIVLAVGSGLGEVLVQVPLLQSIAQWIGIVWLSYLAWQLYRAPVRLDAAPIGADDERRLGLWGAGSLQLINPKTWMMALTVSSVFVGAGTGAGTGIGTGIGTDGTGHILVLSLAFFLIALPCMSAWALLGTGAVRLLQSPQALKRFNQIMAVILLVAAWSVVELQP